MWKHKNFINLQLCAGPIPYEVIVNGTTFSIQRLSDSGLTGENTWSYNASINTDIYSISGNTVVWNDGTILQYSGVDVLPTDDIIGIIGNPGIYTTRSATPTLTFKHFYDAGTIGSGMVKFRHYSQQEPSSGKVIKAGTYKWKAILPKPSQSLDQELVAKVYDLQDAGVRATKMPEANIEYIGFIVGSEWEISQMQEIGDTTIKATFELDDWNTEQYSGMGNQNLQIIVFENDQQVSQEFYDYAITDGNLQALTNWTPHSYFSYILNDRYDVTVNGKTESQGYELKQGDIIRVAASSNTPYTVHFSTISDSGVMSKNTAYTVVDEDIHLYTDKDLRDSTGATITYQK